MAYYNCLLMDIDNTLLDFNAAERKALLETLEHFDLPADDETQQRYHAINSSLWEKLNKGQIKREKLSIERFEILLNELGAQGAPAEINSYYMQQLATHADMIPGAEDMLREVSEVATLIAVSNGAEHVERNRLKLSGLERYFDDILISEQVGIAKPNPKIFSMALRKMGIENPGKALVVGDTLSSDIQGGINAGLDTCWVNFEGKVNETDLEPKYTIRSFNELYAIIMEDDELENVGNKNRKHQNEIV